MSCLSLKPCHQILFVNVIRLLLQEVSWLISQMFSLFLILTFLVSSVLGHEIHDLSDNWDYNDQEEWKLSYPSCGASFQSPIDFQDACFPGSVTQVNNSLRIKLMKYNLRLPTDSYGSLRQGQTLTLKNNGHTAKMILSGTNDRNDWSPKISGSVVNNNIYQFHELHFHWDENDTRGSEHSIHGSRQAMEMHLVHWNMKYGNMKEAANHHDGLAVVAILFTPAIKENKLLSPLVDYLEDIIPFGSEVLIQEYFTLQSLLPYTFQTFYRYQGSLTTPPCSESVTWIVLTQVQKIGYSQLHEFTRLDNRENTFVGDTNRKLQPLNGRIVEVSSDTHCFRNGHEKEDKKRKDHDRLSSVTTPSPNTFSYESTSPSMSRPQEHHDQTSHRQDTIPSFWQLLCNFLQLPFWFPNEDSNLPSYFVTNSSLKSLFS